LRGYGALANIAVGSIVWALSYVLPYRFNFSIGLNTCLQKTADPGDLSQSTAVGYTINHISAVVIPVIGGTFWLINWRLPFIIGACLTVGSFLCTLHKRLKRISVDRKSEDPSSGRSSFAENQSILHLFCLFCWAAGLTGFRSARESYAPVPESR
jgi:hypothetical protein